MPLSTKRLTVADFVLNRTGSFAVQVVGAVFGIALTVFFRRIETVNSDVVPEDVGVIFVMNHPNGLIDPALVFVALPRRISFLAKSTLFRMPVIGWVVRAVGALPVYRRIDAGEDVSQNQKTFDACRELLAHGGSIALFPEGVSHSSPKLLPLKSGAARIALGAASGEMQVPVKIIPVGLYYTSKTTFRSDALLHFGEPFDVPCVELKDGEPPRDAVRELTQKIETALREVTLNAENEAELHAARIAEDIFAAADGGQDLGGEFEFQKGYIQETSYKKNIGNDEDLKKRVKEFDRRLSTFGLEPAHLSLAKFSQGSVVWAAFQYFWRLILLTPFAFVGTVIHLPAYELCRLFSKWYARHGADDVASTAKVLAGVIFMPMTWIILAGVTFYFWRSPLVLMILPLGFLLGYAALYTLEEFEEARGWAKAIVLFLTRREKFQRLFVERRAIQDRIGSIRT
jgi:glycerol-3-phosphate O-acyltransferase / dihydroxyacetone phosphate acyltransferase